MVSSLRSPDDDDDDWWWLSLILFLGTAFIGSQQQKRLRTLSLLDRPAAATQQQDSLLRCPVTTDSLHHHDSVDVHEKIIIDETIDRKFKMELYRLRRMEDRMSFREGDSHPHAGHLPYPPTNNTDTLLVETPNDKYSVTRDDDDYAVGQNRRRRPSVLLMQSNWNHFEGYQPDDDTPVQPVIITTTVQQQQQQQLRRNVQHVDEIHPMIKTSNIFRELSMGSDSGEENLSKLLEGEDLTDRELFCGYEAPKLKDQHHKFMSPSSTPPPFHSSASFTDDESTQPVPLIDHPNTTKPEPPHHIRRRTRSVPDPTRDGNFDGSVPPSTAVTTTTYIDSNRIARAKYNASIMPLKLILIRHGQSLGNVNEKLYATTPDNAMPLTELGWEQARAAGQQLKQLLTTTTTTSTSSSTSNETGVHFIVSPYVRTVETFHGIVSAWCDPSEFDHISNYEQRLNAWYSRLMDLGLTWAEDPRIREQDFGNYQEPMMIQQAKRDRHMFGAFYYRFPLGESASDVSITTLNLNQTNVYVCVYYELH